MLIFVLQVIAKPLIHLFVLATLVIWFRPFIARTKRNSDKVALSQASMWRKETFQTSIYQNGNILTLQMQKCIPLIHLSPNPIYLRIFKRKAQFTWSKAFRCQSLQRIQGLSCLALEFTNSKSVASMICPPLNESHLMFNSEVSITFFKLSMINFGDDLVDSANNAYRPKVF